MSVQGFLFNPFQAQAVVMKAMLEASKEAQDLTVNAVKRAGQRSSSPVEWVTFEMPILDPRSFINEDVMRGTFHRMADQNLRGWEIAADLLKTMPSWMSASAKMPGTVMTDWFDQMRRTSQAMMPANDAWATAADKARPAVKPTTARAAEALTPAAPKTKADAAQPALKAVKPAPAQATTKTTAKRAKPAPAAAKTPAKVDAAAPKPAKRTPAKPAAPKQDGPLRLDAPRGKADDLTAIKGIGEKLASLLNTLGIYHFDQIASWTAKDGRWIDEKLAFKGRVSREKWVEQAKGLAKKAA